MTPDKNKEKLSDQNKDGYNQKKEESKVSDV